MTKELSLKHNSLFTGQLIHRIKMQKEDDGMFMAYFVFFLYCCVVLAISTYHAYRVKRKNIGLITFPLKEAQIYKHLLLIEEDYLKLVEQGKLQAYPQTSKYLKDISAFLDSCCLEIDIKAIVVKEARKIQSVSQRRFLEEVTSAPKDIQDLVFRKNVVALKIIGLQRGEDYLKKSVQRFKIQLFLLKLLTAVFEPYVLVGERFKEVQNIQKIVGFNEKLTECLSA